MYVNEHIYHIYIYIYIFFYACMCICTHTYTYGLTQRTVVAEAGQGFVIEKFGGGMSVPSLCFALGCLGLVVALRLVLSLLVALSFLVLVHEVHVP